MSENLLFYAQLKMLKYFVVILDIFKMFLGLEMQTLDWSMEMSFHESPNHIS